MTLGRLASAVAQILRGKNKPTYTPHVDTGDFVIVVNCDKIKVTGAKVTDKVYTRITGYPGGVRQETFQEAMEKHPSASSSTPSRACSPRTRSDARWARSSRSMQVPSIRIRRRIPARLTWEAYPWQIPRKSHLLGTVAAERLARVRLVPGTGKVTVNKRDAED